MLARTMSSKPAYTARTVSASAPAAANAERLGLPHVVRLGHTLQIVKLAARDSNVCLNDSARLTLRPDFRTGQSRLLVSMGEVDLLAGRAEEARRFADLVLARAREHRQRGDEALSTELVCMRWVTADATLGARADLLPAWPGKARTLSAVLR